MQSNLGKYLSLNAFADKLYHANPANKQMQFMNLSDNEVKHFLQALYNRKVQYILVGGMATIVHGHIRTTQDLDLWVNETPDNKVLLSKAFSDIGLMAADKLLEMPLIPGWTEINIGEHGYSIDLMGYTKAFKQADFADCYKRAKRIHYDDIPITVIHLKDLVKEKLLLARPKDLDDVENLKKNNPEMKF
jgi:predicted nucleotidyltransferase